MQCTLSGGVFESNTELTREWGTRAIRQLAQKSTTIHAIHAIQDATYILRTCGSNQSLYDRVVLAVS